MTTLQINLLDPKAGKLLKNLEEMNLISITNTSEDGFLNLVNKLRGKAKSNPPTLEEITNEVELVRAARYEKAKK